MFYWSINYRDYEPAYRYEIETKENNMSSFNYAVCLYDTSTNLFRSEEMGHFYTYEDAKEFAMENYWEGYFPIAYPSSGMSSDIFFMYNLELSSTRYPVFPKCSHPENLFFYIYAATHRVEEGKWGVCFNYRDEAEDEMHPWTGPMEIMRNGRDIEDLDLFKFDTLVEALNDSMAVALKADSTIKPRQLSANQIEGVEFRKK